MAVVLQQDYPLSRVSRLQRELNKMFDHFGEESHELLPTTDLPMERFWAPVMDVREDDESFIIHAEIPGMKDEDISVEVKDGAVCISGERKFEKKEDGEKYHRVERSYGKFDRRFNLPCKVDPESISATSDRGILEVVIPKPAEPKPKRIKVSRKSS